MTATLSSLNIWRIWPGEGDRTTARFFAAAVPVAYWAPFFVAPLVPGTPVDYPPHPARRVAGLPVILLGAPAPTAPAAARSFIHPRSLPVPTANAPPPAPRPSPAL